MQAASLFIRSAHVSITATMMETVFAQYGIVSHVETVEKKGGPKGPYKQFTIHYSETFNEEFWRKMNAKESVEVVYNAKNNFVKVCLYEPPKKSTTSASTEEDAWNASVISCTIVENPITSSAPSAPAKAAAAPELAPAKAKAETEEQLTSVEKNRRKQISAAMATFKEDMKIHYDDAYAKASSEETSRPKSSPAIEKNRQTQLAASTQKAEADVEKMQKDYDNMTNVEQINAFKSLKEATKAMILKKVKSDAVLAAVAGNVVKAEPIPSPPSVAVEKTATEEDEEEEDEEEDSMMSFIPCATRVSITDPRASRGESPKNSSGKKGCRNISNEEIVERLFPTPVRGPSFNYFDVDAPTEVAQRIDYGPAILPPSTKDRRKKRQAEQEQKAKEVEQEQEQTQQQLQEEAPQIA